MRKPDIELEHLRKDPVMARLIENLEPFEWRASGKIFEDLLGLLAASSFQPRWRTKFGNE
jgi:hypothetical protein